MGGGRRNQSCCRCRRGLGGQWAPGPPPQEEGWHMGPRSGSERTEGPQLPQASGPRGTRAEGRALGPGVEVSVRAQVWPAAPRLPGPQGSLSCTCNPDINRKLTSSHLPPGVWGPRVQRQAPGASPRAAGARHPTGGALCIPVHKSLSQGVRDLALQKQSGTSGRR